MLVLLSFVLVLAAMATLIAGLLGEGLTLIYVSIGCSLAAGLILVLAVLKGRPDSGSSRAAAPPRPASVGASPAVDRDDAPTRTWDTPAATPAPAASAVPADSVANSPSAGSTLRSRTPAAEPAAAPKPSGAPVAAEAAGANLLRRIRGGSAKAPQVDAEVEPQPELETDEPMDEVGTTAASDDGFPIERYDDLRAVEIIAAIERLDVAELEMVRDRESATKNRFTIMNRIDDRMEAVAEPIAAWGPDDLPGDELPANELHEEDVPFLEPGAPIPSPPAPTSSARRPAKKIAKKAPVKASVAKAPVKKVAARRAVPAKAAPAKVAPAKAAPAKAVIAKKAPVKKAAAKKAAPARKVTKKS